MAAKSGTFDITEKTIDFVYNSIFGMAGNAGQESLIEMLKEQMSNGKCILNATVDEEEGFSAKGTMDLDFSSPHPEAIDIIIGKAIEHGELFAKQAEEPGTGWSFDEALSTGNWKILGYDN